MLCLSLKAAALHRVEVIRGRILRELWISNRSRREILFKVRRGNARRHG
jgi:hypothetical protein